MTPRTVPYGTWPSPVTPESLASGTGAVDEVRVDGPDTWWLETRPAEGGRQALVRHDGETGSDVLPEPWNVRTRVHEYGGGAYAVSRRTVVFSALPGDRVHRLDPGSDRPEPITPEGGARYGGLVLQGEVLLAVRETHGAGGEPTNELVRLDLHGRNEDGGRVLARGADFFSRPAVSPDGRHLAWVEWDHPNMPWDSTRLLRAALGPDGAGDPAVVAGGEGVSVVQPQFGPDGSLWFAADECGWWLLHRDTGDGPVLVHDVAADHTAPQWTLGMSDYAVLDADRALVRWWTDDGQGLGILDARTGAVEPLPSAGASHAQLVTTGDEVALVRGRTDGLPEVVRGRPDAVLTVLAGSADEAPDPGSVSPPEPWTWRNGGGDEVHGVLFGPRLGGVEGPGDALPPLLVMAHGGPTSRTEAAFSTAVHFWTTRGFAVLHVNYSGSTGFGRAYRERLQGRWGLVDIDDVATGALSVAGAGRADRSRLAVRGGSAGGYVVLRAMTTSTVFAAGTSLFGVADLTALARDTHKFESRYCDGLVAPWPERAEVYRDRSPVHHVDRLHGELLLLQGDEDRVVPLEQARAMADALRAHGREVELTVYPGEGHGFRREETIVDALRRELDFYTRALRLGEG